MKEKPIPKRIATMNVCGIGFRKPPQNPARLQLALKILDFAHRNKVSCICFPSGFLTTAKIDKIPPLLVPVTGKARELRIFFVLGVDLSSISRLSPNPNAPDFVETVLKQTMPCLLAAYDHRNNALTITRQRSATTEHVRRGLVSDEIMMNPRIMDLGSARFQIIGCGECYDDRIYSPGIPTKAGIIFGHFSMPRLSRTMRCRSEAGFSLVNSEHRTLRGGMLFCYDRGKNKTFHNCRKYVEHGDLWADLAVWELTERMRFHPVHEVKD